ncbi:MAG: arginase [Chloroflexota bacterium]
MNVAIIGAPVDLGADRRGVDMGPSAIRYAGLEVSLQRAGHVVCDLGNISAPVVENAETGSPHLKYLSAIIDVCDNLADVVAQALADGFFPLILGGDHSVSLGSVAGVSRNRKIGLLWIDAHGDYNTEKTSPSGNIHGMVLSALTGKGDSRLINIGGVHPKIDPQNAALIAVRELDSGERSLLHGSGVQVYTMHDIDRAGLSQIIALALDRMPDDLDGLHLSLDLDVVDPLQAPGVGTPVLGGLSYRETHLALELIAESRRAVSMDVVEVNPVLDNRNETARLAVEFTLSALGKRIY